MATKGGNAESVQGRFEFDGLGDEAPPVVRAERVDANGNRYPIEFGKDGSITLDTRFVGQRNLVELTGTEGEDPRRFHLDDLVAHLRERDTYVLPADVWRKWFPQFRVVSGKVEICKPIFWLDGLFRSDANVLHKAGIGAIADLRLAVERPAFARIKFPQRCQPVCDGTVDVYIRTCCCTWFDPCDILRHICEIIDCHLVTNVPVDGGDPVGPIGPGPVESLAHSEAVLTSIKRSLRDDPALPGTDQILELYRHHTVLSALAPREQVAYIKANPVLQWLGCHCTLVKVASVPIQEDGTFDAFFRLPHAGHHCTQRVVYVVTQPTTSGPKIIYDGRVAPMTFGLSEEADLHVSWSARPCGRDDSTGDVGVFLNRIGATNSSALVRSVEQDGENSYAALATTDGLVNGGANVWGGTLALRYSFHKDLKALGAQYYRVRVQQVDDNGDPVGAPIDHNTPIAWGLFQGTQIVSTSIGPNTISSVQNLYTIPYYVDNWDFDANSYHAFINTDALIDNARYVLVVDIFNSAGHRLVPTTGPAPGPNEVAAAFSYLRVNVTGSPAVEQLDPVHQKALATLVRVDNTPADAAFTGLRQTFTAGGSNDVFTGCQFLIGKPTDGVQVRYQAHHDKGWLDVVSLSLTEGIGGPTTALVKATTTPSNTFDTGAPPASALTQSVTIGSLLGADQKCSFAATMLVTTRHTNGSGAVTNLWASAAAAFALEQT